MQPQLGLIQYAVTDGGGNIKKALRQQSIPHIYDYSHQVALYFKHQYADHPAYLAFTQAASRCRRYQSQSIVAPLLPPLQKKKAHYMNLGPLSAWGQQLLTFLAQPPTPTTAPLQERMQWVTEHCAIMEELSQLYTRHQKVARPSKNGA